MSLFVGGFLAGIASGLGLWALEQWILWPDGGDTDAPKEKQDERL